MAERTETIHSQEDVPALNVLRPVPPMQLVVTVPSAFNLTGTVPIVESVSWDPIAATFEDIDEATPLDWSQTYTAGFDEEVAQSRQLEIEQPLNYLLGSGSFQEFEDGMKSAFADGIESWVSRYRNEALNVLATLSVAEQIDPPLLAESLMSLGNFDDPITRDRRFWLLAASLRHSSPEVRDAAGLGLAALGDPRAAIHLRRAIEREPIEELQNEFARVEDYFTP